MPYLASPLSELKPHYDVLIVGSGYGGSIAASVLARARTASRTPISVCLLERGREIPVGRFPATAEAAAAQFQVDAEGHHVGHKDGLFWMHAGKDVSVINGCGLGGTSLINANVSLPPEKRVWDDPRWPKGLLDDRQGGLAQGFERAQQMLRPVPYPGELILKKFAALRDSAAQLGATDQCYYPPINVTFRSGLNHVGVDQPACTGCGDCVSGCNVGSKNTLMMNYLPDARNHGAEIYCRIDVRQIEQTGSGWRVYFQPVGSDREKFDAGEVFVEANVVVVSAGTLGSNRILLHSKRAGLRCSDRLGNSFSGNGDVLGFGYNNDREINAVGNGERPVDARQAPGPCITGIIDRRSGGVYADAHVIEEGVLPGAVAQLIPEPMRLVAELTGDDTDSGIWDEITETARQWASALPGGAYRGAMRNTQTYLMMSHDDSSGKVVLDGDGVSVSWPGVGEQPHFKKMNEQLRLATKANGGTYVPSPTFNKAFGYGLVTVHPLGGCIMAEDADRGVTDHKGHVFSGNAGNEAYDSLYVADGSVLPCSVGVNPLLTISAIAERNMRLLATDRGWVIDDTPSSGAAQYDGRPDTDAGTSIRFTEKMAGHCSTSLLAEGAFEQAETAGEQQGSPCHFVLTISSPNVNQLIEDPNHAAGIIGTVDAPALSRAPMSVLGGNFNLFVPDTNNAGGKRMLYRMTLRSVEGEDFYFDGFKKIRNDAKLDVWPDTTTLYVAIYRGQSAAGVKVAQGILHITEQDFARQLTTMHAETPDGKPAPAAVAAFGKLFAQNLWEVYGLGG